MPNYARPFSELGAGAGSLLGGGLTGLLGQLSGIADAPRKAIWNGVTGLFGDPTDSGSELLGRMGMNPDSMWTHVLGTGLEMATDPLTWMGALGGATRGAKLGAEAGKGLEAAAITRGPRYAGGVEKLTGAGIPDTVAAQSFLHNMKVSPHLSRALEEVPPGSQWLGGGMEAGVFRTPSGDTLRLSPNSTDTWDRMARANIPEMLPASRAGLVGDIRVERAPLADTSAFSLGPRSPGLEARLRDYAQRARQGPNPAVADMERAVERRGYQAVDISPQNLGTYQGHTRVIDPGAVASWPDGPQSPALPDWSTHQPGRFTNWLLDRLGSEQTLQQELARGVGGY